MNFYLLIKWKSSDFSFSIFAAFWFFDFLLPFVEKTEGSKIEKSSCEIRGKGARALPILLRCGENAR